MVLATALAALLLASSVLAEETTIPLTRRKGWRDSNGAVNMTAYVQEINHMAVKYEKNARILRKNLFDKKTPGARMLRERGTVQLAIADSYVWTGPATIGTPPQSFSVYFDTGSSDFTVPDSTCPASSCGKKKRYTVSSSSTAVVTNTKTSTTFVDGSTSKGTLIKDTVKIGGLSVTNQGIISSTSLSTTVADLNSDALMGLAWSSLATSGQTSIPVTMANQNVGTKQIFGMALSMTPGKSSLTFGGYDRTKVTGTIRYYPVAPDSASTLLSYWQIAASAPFVNGLQAIKQRINMILDSGTTLIIAPKAAATEFWAKIPTSKKYDDNFWVYRCDTPPTIDFGFTRVFQHWSMDVEETFNLGNIAEDPDYCMGAVATQDLGLGTSWILGDAAMLNWYVIHDVGNKRIGLANKR